MNEPQIGQPAGTGTRRFFSLLGSVLSLSELSRSREMEMIELFLPIDSAHDIIDEFAKLGLVQFRDLNPSVNAFQRNFVYEVKRFDELERKLRYFDDQIEKHHIRVGDRIEQPFKEQDIRTAMDELEARCSDLERELIQMNANRDTLERNNCELIELQQVYTVDSSFFGHSGEISGIREESPLLDERSTNLGLITGVVPRDKKAAFERVLWRATRGNMLFQSAEIPELIKDPNTGELVEKNVFMIFYQGVRSESKIRKLCESFQANIYKCPENSIERDEAKKRVEEQLHDLRQVLHQTEDEFNRILSDVAKNIDAWKKQTLKEKAIYHTMNLFKYDVGHKCLIAEGWCPAENDQDVRTALVVGTQRSGTSIHPVMNIVPEHQYKDTPPTYFKTNKFTSGFQDITDAYGTARYQEMNPTPFLIVTFPFLFGVMFGDVGHGTILFLFALLLVIFEKKFEAFKTNEMFGTIYYGRYTLLLMGMFSIYSGFLYNECFSIPMAIFPTNWQYIGNTTTDQGQWAVPIHNATYTYPFGIDYMWVGSADELDYEDSLKMKMSVIIGVIQMSLGICLSLLNAIHFRKYLDIVCEFIPEIVFLVCTFGYMDFLIIYKWLHNWWNISYPAPLLMNTMIGMFLTPWELPTGNWTTQVFTQVFPDAAFQRDLQIILLLLAVISVPILLIPKPIILHKQAMKKKEQEQLAKGYEKIVEEESKTATEEEHSEAESHGHDEGDLSELMIHQIIHTIEFVLGTISNTASYLRLWALSLAHSELSSVFFQLTLGIGLRLPSAIIFVAGFAVWAGATVGILLGMEALSAFLHALRLHWVEFQNKFYKGDGYKFAPLSYEKLISGELVLE